MTKFIFLTIGIAIGALVMSGREWSSAYERGYLDGMDKVTCMVAERFGVSDGGACK